MFVFSSSSYYIGVNCATGCPLIGGASTPATATPCRVWSVRSW